MFLSFQLKMPTPKAWVLAVLQDFDKFLLDHAACERKASALAMSMLAHYPDKEFLVKKMTNLAIEELVHFKQVMHFVLQRNLVMLPDTRDFYVNQLLKEIRKGRDEYFLDRLLVASVIEARGAERFRLIADNLDPKDECQIFYKKIADSEEKHYELFLELAAHYFDQDLVVARVDELLSIEAQIIAQLPIIPAVH